MVEAPVELPLTFLGDRPYLQGTTLFDALLPHVPAAARVTFRLANLMHTDRVEVVARTAEGPGDSWDATLTWEAAGESGILGVRGLPPAPVPRRTPYDEARLTALADFAPGKVSLEVPSPFDFCATIVSLHKALLHRELPQPGAGRWLFVRLDLDHLPGPHASLAVVRQSVMAGGRLVKSRILLDGVAVGDLYFSWLSRN